MSQVVIWVSCAKGCKVVWTVEPIGFLWADKILFVSLIAAIVSQSSDLQTFGLSDGIDNHNLTCSEEITGEDRHKKKDVISGLCVGEVYQFRNLKYFFKDGKLVVIMIKVIH